MFTLMEPVIAEENDDGVGRIGGVGEDGEHFAELGVGEADAGGVGLPELADAIFVDGMAGGGVGRGRDVMAVIGLALGARDLK